MPTSSNELDQLPSESFVVGTSANLSFMEAAIAVGGNSYMFLFWLNIIILINY